MQKVLSASGGIQIFLLDLLSSFQSGAENKKKRKTGKISNFSSLKHIFVKKQNSDTHENNLYEERLTRPSARQLEGLQAL